jgi:hypothetical protein
MVLRGRGSRADADQGSTLDTRGKKGTHQYRLGTGSPRRMSEKRRGVPNKIKLFRSKKTRFTLANRDEF